MDIHALITKMEDSKSRNEGINPLIHVWLQGFDDISQGKQMDLAAVRNYVVNRAHQFLPFTPLLSSAFVSAHAPYFKEGRMSFARLPIDNTIHLQFPLMIEGNRCGVYRAPCELCEEKGEKHKLMVIEVRRSRMMESLFDESKGATMYDNRINPRSMTGAQLFEAYHVLDDFISTCRK